MRITMIRIVGGVFFLLLFSSVTLVFPQQNAWTKMTDMPATGKTTSVDEINGKIYIMGAGATNKSFLEYDPKTDAYTTLADMPASRSSIPDGAAANGHFYTFGGNVSGGGNLVTSVYGYNPETDSWKEVSSFPTGRVLLRVCACDGKIYTGGAYYKPKRFEIYDPVSDSWDERSETAPPMGSQAMCACNGKVYCFGGSYGLHDVWEYDPVLDTWEAKAPMPTGRSGAAAASVDGKIYVFGGTADAVHIWNPPLDVVEMYDPQEDKWYVDYPAMPTPRFWAGACAVESLIYVIGGYQGNWGQGAQTVNEVFNPALVMGNEYTETPDDSEHTWQLHYTGASEGYSDKQFSPIKVVDKNVVWIGGVNGVFVRTTDAGANWSHGVVLGAESLAFYSIAAIDAMNAHFVACGNSNARIYKTDDGGKNWFMAYQNTKPAAFLDAIVFFDEKNGIAMGDPVDGEFLILTTNDGGYSWQPVPGENIPDPLPGEWGAYAGYGGTGLAVFGENHAWFGTGYGATSSNDPLRVFYSTDKGQTWNVSDTPLPTTGQYHGITTIAFKDKLTGFAASHGSDELGEGKNLVKTTDGGKTWHVVPGFVQSNSQTSTIQFVPGTDAKVVVASTAGGLACSGDGGETWKVLDNDPFFGISFIDSTTGWGTTNYGLVGKYIGTLSRDDDPISVVALDNQPQLFQLQQNYPNPFNPTTTIEYVLPSASFVTLDIYDLLGRNIRTLVQEQQAAGTHSVVFDASELSSTIYFYKLQAGDHSQIRKMAVVK